MQDSNIYIPLGLLLGLSPNSEFLMALMELVVTLIRRLYHLGFETTIVWNNELKGSGERILIIIILIFYTSLNS